MNPATQPELQPRSPGELQKLPLLRSALGHGLAIVAVAAAMGMRLALEAWVGPGLPTFITFYPAVMVVALLAGFWPGMMATTVTASVVGYWIMPPVGEFAIASPVDRLALAFFFGMGLFMCSVAGLYRRNRDKVAAFDHEETLRESRERLATFAAASFEGIVESEAGRVLDCNEQFARMSGYTVTELRGLEIVSLIAPEDLDRVMANIRIGEELVIEHAMLRKDGTRIVVEAHGRPVSPGSARRHTAVRDVTEWKRAEERLRTANAELEMRILERTRELQEANESLEQRVAGRTDELLAANTKLLDSRRATLNMMEDAGIARRAALNVMEDAIVARRQAEESTAELLREATERTRAEAAVRQSEEQYRSLFTTMLEGFCIIEVQFDRDDHPVDYRFLECNPAFEAQTGLWNAQGKLMRELAPEHEAHWFEIYGNVALTGESVRFVHEAKALNRWFDVSAYRVEERESRKVAILFNDITERQQAEADLLSARNELEQRVAKRTEELALSIKLLQDEVGERERAEESLLRLNRLYAVLSETDQAIVRLGDRDTLFREFCRIAVEEGGFILSWIGLVDEETGLVKMIEASGATGYLDDIRITSNDEPTGEGPTGISIREGTYYICNDFLNEPCTRPWHERGRAHGIQASASIALKQDGRVIGALTLYSGEKDFFDSTQVKLLVQLGEEISFAMSNLEHASRRREAEQALQQETMERLQAVETLRIKEQMLVQQSRQAAMGEMIGNIAHQWRQPLNVLALILQELSITNELGSFPREDLDASITKSLQIIYHMSQTIDGFRDFFRPDKETVPFSPLKVAVRTVALVDASFRELQIDVDISGADDIIIQGYPNEYSQVILNILMNARDAFQERAPSGPRTIRISLTRENMKTVLNITDNAGGIPGEVMEKIFDPYFSTKGPDKGTGLGLFMSKTIIEKNMSGRLSACNAGEGATFRIEV
jgi:PAS domain S-box-containing protein